MTVPTNSRYLEMVNHLLKFQSVESINQYIKSRKQLYEEMPDGVMRPVAVSFTYEDPHGSIDYSLNRETGVLVATVSLFDDTSGDDHSFIYTRHREDYDVNLSIAVWRVALYKPIYTGRVNHNDGE